MTIKSTLTLALMATSLLTVSAMTQEKKIRRSDLPPAVEKTVATQSEGATIKGFATENEKGQVFYEAELKVKGHSKDVLMKWKSRLQSSHFLLRSETVYKPKQGKASSLRSSP